MKRRDILAILGSTPAWPLAAMAQQAAMPTVGYVWTGHPNNDISGLGLRQGLADRGYVIGRNLGFEGRYAKGDLARVPALIAELLALKVDVLVTVGTQSSLLARRATSTVPIVSGSGDPVGSGLAVSLDRPGGNVTGVSILAGDYSAKWPELMKEALPKLRRIAVLYNPDNPAIVREVEQLQASARTLHLEVSTFVGSPGAIDHSLADIAGGDFDGFVVTTDASIESRLPQILAFAAEHRLPALYPFSTAVQHGGLMSYSIDFFAVWRRAAHYVDRILKGDRPADLPIEQPTTVLLNINLKTANVLGITIPPTLLARADEVIE
jgi:putative ABC transport system substrate-binding protein